MEGLGLEAERDASAADAHDSLTLADLSFLYALTTERSSNTRTKRTFTDCDKDGDGRLSDGSQSSATTETLPSIWNNGSDDGGLGVALSPTTTMPKTKQRKRTHVINREEKEKLQDEVMYLEARLALLRGEAGVIPAPVIDSKRALCSELRDAVLQHDLNCASMQSIFSDFTNSRSTSPLESYIHLTTDWQERRDALLAMKDRKIDVAHRFLLERTRFVNPFQEWRECSQFVSAEGDFCMTIMDMVLFERVTSLRQVFDAMQFYFMNLEITLTEMSGNVTIRENDENTETAVLQHRLVTSERDGVLVEKNVVLFFDTSGLDCDNVDDQNALVTADFVDRDDLYPYCPSERLRRDATCVMKLSAHRRKRKRVVPSSNYQEKRQEEDEVVVVLTRWFHVQLRRPQFEISESVVRSIAEDITGGSGGDPMLKSMRDSVHLATTSGQ
ncbi:hypothetical protein FI667_g7662, partial [Globisporangium splendens]